MNVDPTGKHEGGSVLYGRFAHESYQHTTDGYRTLIAAQPLLDYLPESHTIPGVVFDGASVLLPTPPVDSMTCHRADTHGSVSRRTVLSGIGAAALGSLAGCLRGIPVIGDQSESPGDLIIENNHTKSHSVAITVTEALNSHEIAEYSVKIDPDGQHLKRDVLNQSGRYTVRAVLDGDVEETYDGADMRKNECGELTGKAVTIRITEKGGLQVFGFVGGWEYKPTPWPPDTPTTDDNASR